MEIPGNTLLILAVILFFGLIVPHLFKRFELPSTPALILLGAALGPSGFGYIEPDQTMYLFGFLGAAFHMLLAGFEAETNHIRQAGRRLWILITVNSLIPFVTGTAIVRGFGYSWEVSLLMGAVFISSSIMIVFSNVRNLGIGGTELGRTLRSLTVVQDLASSMVLFILFKYMEPHQRFSLPILMGLLISSVVILRMFLPEVVGYLFKRFGHGQAGHESQLRIVIALLLFIMVIYSAMDVHPVIAAFLVGFTLSEIPRPESVRNKLHTIGYGLFIPIYMFIIGVEIDLTIFSEFRLANTVILVLIVGAFLSKFISGWLSARATGFRGPEAGLIGISSTAKLAVTMSSAYAAFTLNLIDNNLYSAIVLISALSTVANPVLMLLVGKRLKKGEEKPDA